MDRPVVRKYTPGARVTPDPVEPRKKRRRLTRASKGPFPGCCSDVLERILGFMVQRHEGLSVIKLSMVNKWFRKEISENVGIWRQLYLQWRGPIEPYAQRVLVPAPNHWRPTLVRLRPNKPRTYPNFRDRIPGVP
jgi:hypothetical protein